MTAKAAYSTPMLHVASIETSIALYELMGFATIDTDRGTPLGSTRLHCDDMPSGMTNFRDPDGYIIEIAHWSATQQQAWEKCLATKP